jgi:hypothetical protein
MPAKNHLQTRSASTIFIGKLRQIPLKTIETKPSYENANSCQKLRPKLRHGVPNFFSSGEEFEPDFQTLANWSSATKSPTRDSTELSAMF